MTTNSVLWQITTNVHRLLPTGASTRVSTFQGHTRANVEMDTGSMEMDELVQVSTSMHECYRVLYAAVSVLEC